MPLSFGRLEAEEGAWFPVPDRIPASLVPVLSQAALVSTWQRLS